MLCCKWSPINHMMFPNKRHMFAASFWRVLCLTIRMWDIAMVSKSFIRLIERWCHICDCYTITTFTNVITFILWCVLWHGNPSHLSNTWQFFYFYIFFLVKTDAQIKTSPIQLLNDTNTKPQSWVLKGYCQLLW